MKKLLIFFYAAVSCFGCGNQTKNNAEEKRLHIEIPTPPTMMSDYDKAEYIVMHYWDNFDFSDTAYVNKEIPTEEAYGGYAYILVRTDDDIAARSIDKTMTAARADSSMYAYFAELAEKYFYDPNSPVRNEDIYIKVLENIISWSEADELVKLRPRAQLEMALKNRVGEKANDIVITLNSGATTNLHSIKADYTLLFVNNPDCSACGQLIRDIGLSDILDPLIKGGKLKVVAVYPDEDITAWKNYLDKMPKNWTNGYDARQIMRNNGTYDLRAIPTLYLLDRNKTVLLKDVAEILPLEEYFYYNNIVM